jgi:acyl-CoA dehydrogenase
MFLRRSTDVKLGGGEGADMDGTGTLLTETASRLFRDLAAAKRDTWRIEGWSAIEAAGLHLALLPEQAGGFGVTIADALGLLRIAGETALAQPLAETMIAIAVIAEAGLAIPAGPLSIAAAEGATLALRRHGTSWHLTGEVPRVPWGSCVAAVALSALAEGRPMAAVVPAGHFTAEPATNLAGEPRDTLRFDTILPEKSVAPARIGAAELRALGAAARCQQIAGALAHITAMSVAYAQERVQFGRPIGRFQAVQQSLATLAGHAAAAAAAADCAADAIFPDLRRLSIAAAKSRAGEAAGAGAAIAHQIHGAMGFTQEHSLHRYTSRLWSWRDEFGHEAAWNRDLGHHLAAAGPARLWAEITAL